MLKSNFRNHRLSIDLRVIPPTDLHVSMFTTARRSLAK